MLVLTAIANEFPLLAAVADELGDADHGNEVARLQTARRLLQDACRSLNHTPDMVDVVPSTNGVVVKQTSVRRPSASEPRADYEFDR